MDILVSRNASIQTVEFNRPHRRNAFTSGMYAELASALRVADGDPSIRVILLRGQSDVFSAGNDLDDFVAHPPDSADAPAFAFIGQLAAVRKPVVAAVGGAAVGIGTTMLFHCDLVYAGEGARFSLPFVRLGLCPEAASSMLLPARIGHQRAADVMLFGNTFDAQAARAFGFVNDVVPDAALLSHADTQARTLAQLPASSVAATKALLKSSASQQVERQLALEGPRFHDLLAGPAAREAIAAFREKRKPDFSSID